MSALSHRRPGWISHLREAISFAALDLADLVRGRRDPLVPPRRLLFDGPRDPAAFVDNGREFLRHYVDLCRLRPDESVLDVGSGIGRKTVPLTTFLSPSARYVGIDVHRRGIAWCSARISSRFPNFEFQHVDVFNRRYNPGGTIRDAEFRFPFTDEKFDFVILGSVFTHMLPAGVAQYLREIVRVMRPGTGRCLISFFLLGPEAEAGIAGGRSVYRFAYRHDDYAVENPELPEDAVAYDEVSVRRLYAEAGLEISAIHPGGWSGRANAVSFQDLVVARPAS